jgi:hypothetical protein
MKRFKRYCFAYKGENQRRVTTGRYIADVWRLDSQTLLAVEKEICQHVGLDNAVILYAFPIFKGEGK